MTCDFCSVMHVLRTHIKLPYSKNWVGLTETLFASYIKVCRPYGLEPSTVAKWCTGARNVPVCIIDFYDGEQTLRALTDDISEWIVPAFYDMHTAVNNLRSLVASDPSISDAQKQAILSLSVESDKEVAATIAKIVVLAINHPCRGFRRAVVNKV